MRANISPRPALPSGVAWSRAAIARPAVVVLPFDNLSDDPNQDYFCDGLTQDITTDLSKFTNLLVIAANSAFTYKGRHVKVPQTGRVEIGSDVEIGANCTVDRATFEATRIGDGSKIDNLVMIGHNNQIGRHNLLCGQVGIAGSCKTGDYVVMAGQAGIKDKTEIGNQVVVGAQAGVHRNVPDGQQVLGSPAIPVREQRKNVVLGGGGSMDIGRGGLERDAAEQ